MHPLQLLKVSSVSPVSLMHTISSPVAEDVATLWPGLYCLLPCMFLNSFLKISRNPRPALHAVFIPILPNAHTVAEDVSSFAQCS